MCIRDRFDRKGSFTLWQRRVKDILIQQGLARALKGNDSKPEKMTKEEWEDLESKCVSTIRFCFVDNIINNVIDEDSTPTLWEKLEKLYLGKKLNNEVESEAGSIQAENGGWYKSHGTLKCIQRVAGSTWVS